MSETHMSQLKLNHVTHGAAVQKCVAKARKTKQYGFGLQA